MQPAEQRDVRLEEELAGNRGDFALPAESDVGVDVVLLVALPEQRPVVVAADDQFLGVDFVPGLVADPCAPDHVGDRVEGRQAVLLGCAGQGVVAHGVVKLVSEQGRVCAELIQQEELVYRFSGHLAVVGEESGVDETRTDPVGDTDLLPSIIDPS